MVFGKRRHLQKRFEEVSDSASDVAVVFKFSAEKQSRLIVQCRTSLVDLGGANLAYISRSISAVRY